MSNVVPLPTRRRAQQLQLALDGVPTAIGFAAGLASVALQTRTTETARARLERLRAQWHHDVNVAIDQALDEIGAAS